MFNSQNLHQLPPTTLSLACCINIDLIPVPYLCYLIMFYDYFYDYLYYSIFTCVSYAEARNRYRLDVRLSVRPSVTRWHGIKTAEYIVMISSPHDCPFILVLCTPRSSRNSTSNNSQMVQDRAIVTMAD